MFEKEINCPILTPTLQLKTGEEETVETGAFSLVKIGGGISRPIYANTAMPALDGTVGDDEQSIFIFGVKYDADGLNEYITMKSENKAKTEKMNASDIPMLSAEYAPLGYVLVINETGSDFVGGTTPMNTPGITTIFVNNFGFVGY
jgi:hypothetical protein